MVTRRRTSPHSTPTSLTPLDAIRLEGFKSYRDNTEVDIKPLTLLAGRNSAGKSSLVQPLLLMKQTLEAPYGVHPFLWLGACVRIHDASSLLWQSEYEGEKTRVSWLWGVKSRSNWVSTEIRQVSGRWVVEYQDFLDGSGKQVRLNREGAGDVFGGGAIFKKVFDDDSVEWEREIVEEGGGLNVILRGSRKMPDGLGKENSASEFFGFETQVNYRNYVSDEIYTGLIHLPGLRGNPERSYPTTHVNYRFPGSFTPYTASVLAAWKEQGDDRLEKVQNDLKMLGLVGAVEPRRLNDVEIELRVGRCLQDSHASVNIADVGFGVSQVMPVVVALRVALPGQTVHIEQPELHLHPNAQVAMAELLLDAARRGVRVIAETHSAVLLKAVQVAVAEGRAEPDLVALHWFDRDEEGATKVTTAELDSEGAYGAWPVDFADVELDIERRFIMAPFK